LFPVSSLAEGPQLQRLRTPGLLNSHINFIHCFLYIKIFIESPPASGFAAEADLQPGGKVVIPDRVCKKNLANPDFHFIFASECKI
jgi:hypothetical protein